MRFEIPGIYQDIKLSDYAPEFGEQAIHIRVNPPQKVISELYQLQKELTNENIESLAKIIGELWEWSPEEVIELFAKSYDTDPKFFEWLIVKTLWMIQVHRAQVKKNWMVQLIN